MPHSVDWIAQYFVGLIVSSRYAKSRHVRRVLPWLGFILKGLERAGMTYSAKQRQLQGTYRGVPLKVRYNHRIGHRIGRRGGIEIVRIMPGPGQPDGPVVASITSVDDAEAFYRNPKAYLVAALQPAA